VKNVVKSSSHIDMDLLGEYVLYQSSNEFSDIVISKVAPKIETHLRSCNDCMENYKMLSEEYEEVNDFVENSITEQKVVVETKNDFIITSIFQNSFFKYASAFAAILIIYTGALVFSNISLPNYQSKVIELKSDLSHNSRGRATENFLIAVSEMEKGNEESAIKALQNDLNENKNSQTIFYTHFILGQIYLQNASNDFLGIKLGFDENSLNNSISEFNKVIQTNQDSRFANINLDAKYFIAQANLLLENVDEAKVNLNEVIEQKGKYLSQAKELLNEIEGE
jgi:predicted nucleic-acid-binding protein